MNKKIIISKSFLFFELLIVILLITFLALTARFFWFFLGKTPTPTSAPTGATRLISAAQYEKISEAHHTKVTRAAAFEPQTIHNPFFTIPVSPSPDQTSQNSNSTPHLAPQLDQEE